MAHRRLGTSHSLLNLSRAISKAIFAFHFGGWPDVARLRAIADGASRRRREVGPRNLVFAAGGQRRHARAGTRALRASLVHGEQSRVSRHTPVLGESPAAGHGKRVMDLRYAHMR